MLWLSHCRRLTINTDSDFSSRLELKGRLDQTIGIGVLQHESSILILTTGVMMKVTLDLDSVKFFDAEYEKRPSGDFTC